MLSSSTWKNSGKPMVNLSKCLDVWTKAAMRSLAYSMQSWWISTPWLQPRGPMMCPTIRLRYPVPEPETPNTTAHIVYLRPGLVENKVLLYVQTVLKPGLRKISDIYLDSKYIGYFCVFLIFFCGEHSI